LDAGYLAEILRADTSIYGLTTEFACPVIVTVYLAPDSPLSADKLKNLIEQKLALSDNNESGRVPDNLNYKVTDIRKASELLSLTDYLRIIEDH